MIQVDRDNLLIEFLSKWKPGDNEEKALKSRRYPLISCYICPFCDGILRAYFQTHGDRFEVFPYEEATAHYARLFVDFWSPSEDGGGIVARSHNANTTGGRGGSCSHKIFASMHADTNAHDLARGFDMEFEPWITKALYNLEIEGVTLIRDLCERDDPLIAFNEKALEPQWKLGEQETYDEFQARRNTWRSEWAKSLRHQAKAAGLLG